MIESMDGILWERLFVLRKWVGLQEGEREGVWNKRGGQYKRLFGCGFFGCKWYKLLVNFCI